MNPGLQDVEMSCQMWGLRKVLIYRLMQNHEMKNARCEVMLYIVPAGGSDAFLDIVQEQQGCSICIPLFRGLITLYRCIT